MAMIDGFLMGFGGTLGVIVALFVLGFLVSFFGAEERK